VSDFGKIFFGLASAIAWSTVIIHCAIPRLARSNPQANAEGVSGAPQKRPHFLQEAGFWIGGAESVLIFILVFLGEFAALALLEGFKQSVRQGKTSMDSDAATRMFLAFLTNLTVAVSFAFWTKQVVSAEFFAGLR